MIKGRILGFDALPQSSPQSKRREPAYAVIVIDGGEIVYQNKSISRSALPRLTQSWDVTYIACDNVLEIASNGKEITEFCKALPENTNLVQVTGNPLQGKLEKLTRLVKRYNISLQQSGAAGHLAPLAAAEAAAQLTRHGVGYICEPFEKECKITVSKSRHIGPGGSSAQRFERRIRGAVRRVTRELRHLLQENRIEFDEFDMEGYQGLNKATFYAYISLSKAKTLLRSIDESDLAKIVIERVVKDELGYFPLVPETYSKRSTRKNPAVIVGLDPGTTTGLAIINLRGKPILLHSEREYSTRKIIRQIMKYGNPVLVACDVPSTPKTVEKIANSFDVPVSSVKKPVSVAEKIQIAHEFQEKYEVSVGDTHQRDALVAALKAFNALKNKLEKIEAEVKKLDNTLPFEDIKMAVIHGKSLSEAISETRDAIQLHIERAAKQKEIATAQSTNDIQLRRELESLREKVTSQQQFIEDLEQTQLRLSDANKSLNEQIAQLERTITNLKRKKSFEVEKEKRVQIRDAEITRLRQQLTAGKTKIARLQRSLAKIERMNTIILKGRYIPLKLLKNLSLGAIEEAEKAVTILPGDVIYIKDPSGGSHRTAEELCKRQVRAIVAKTLNISHLALKVFQEAGIPIFTEEDVDAIWIDKFILISRDLLEQRMASHLLKREEELNAAEAPPLDLEDIILSYKDERKKVLDQLRKETTEKLTSSEGDEEELV